MSAAGASPLLQVALFAQPALLRGIAALALARTSYFALLFVAAQFVQTGLGEGALASAVALVGWVACYGIAGLVYARLPARLAAIAPGGAAVMAGSFGASALATAVRPGDVLVLVLTLGLGGFGFGTLSTATIGRLTGIVEKAHGADLSGVLATLVPLSAVAGVATFGGLYLALTGPTPAGAAHAFVATCALLAVTTTIATVVAADERGARSPAAARS